MMASRESLKILCKQINGRQWEVWSRSLRSLALGGRREAESKGFGVSRVGALRTVSSSVHHAQISSQLEVNIAASDSAPGSQTSAGERIPPEFPTPSEFQPDAPTPVENLDVMGLVRVMSNAFSYRKMYETVRLYDEWMKGTDAEGNPKKPNILVYNFLLHAKLSLGAHPNVMHQIVADMERNGVKPNHLSFNFLLRSVFLHRDSVAAEHILEKMERGDPEQQPDSDAYNFVISLCALSRRLPAAMKHLQAMHERNLVPSKAMFNEVLLGCARAHLTQTAVDVMKQLEAHGMVPEPQNLVGVALAATEVDDSVCALAALQRLNGRSSPKAVPTLAMDEGSIVAILGTAARSANAELAKEAWELLKVSLGPDRAPKPASYLALVHALSTSQQFDAVFRALAEIQILFGTPQNEEELEILSPFSSLRPLVITLSQLGPAGLDRVYFKLVDMHSAGSPVPLAALNCLLLACANIWDASRAYQTFDSIGSTFGLRPNIHSINSLLEAFGKDRKTVEAVKLFNYITESGVTPDQRSFELMIYAHVVNRDVQSASAILSTMITAGHTPRREILYKLWRRCGREGDKEKFQDLRKLFARYGYQDCSIGERRRREMISIAKQIQAEPR